MEEPALKILVSTGKYNFPENESFKDFHIYSLEWDYNEIRWYVDKINFFQLKETGIAKKVMVK